jgi:hypothetical protein
MAAVPTARIPATDSVMPPGSLAPPESTPKIPPRATLAGNVEARSNEAWVPTVSGGTLGRHVGGTAGAGVEGVAGSEGGAPSGEAASLSQRQPERTAAAAARVCFSRRRRTVSYVMRLLSPRGARTDRQIEFWPNLRVDLASARRQCQPGDHVPLRVELIAGSEPHWGCNSAQVRPLGKSFLQQNRWCAATRTKFSHPLKHFRAVQFVCLV